jgi:hypothetical protein
MKFSYEKSIIVAEIISAAPNNVFSFMQSKYSFIYSKSLSKIPGPFHRLRTMPLFQQQ